MIKQKGNKVKVNPKLYSLVFLFIFIFSFVSAFGYNSGNEKILNIGDFKQGQQINLVQTCSNCSYNNVTTIKLPDGTLTSVNSEMTKDGTFYNYSFTDSSLIGEYIVNGVGDENGEDSVWSYAFNISGGMIWVFVIVFVLSYGLTFYGIKIKNPWVSLFGCMGLLVLGVYTSFNGVEIYKNQLTTLISYVTIAIGLGIGFESLREITYL